MHLVRSRRFPTEPKMCNYYAPYVVMKYHVENLKQSFEEMFTNQKSCVEEKTQLVEELKVLAEKLSHAQKTIKTTEEDSRAKDYKLRAMDKTLLQLQKKLKEKDKEINSLKECIQMEDYYKFEGKKSPKGTPKRVILGCEGETSPFPHITHVNSHLEANRTPELSDYSLPSNTPDTTSVKCDSHNDMLPMMHCNPVVSARPMNKCHPDEGMKANKHCKLQQTDQSSHTTCVFPSDEPMEPMMPVTPMKAIKRRKLMMTMNAMMIMIGMNDCWE